MTKAHVPTPQLRTTIETMSACGVPQEDIGKVLGIDSKTMRKHYRHELDTAAIKATATIASALFSKAKQGDNTAMIFWLKTRAGWRETSTVEHVGEGGGPIKAETKLTAPEFAEIARSLLAEI